MKLKKQGDLVYSLLKTLTVWDEPKSFPKTYDEEIDLLKSWIKKRINWIDKNISKI